MSLKIDSLLREVVELKGSDLHLTVGLPPVLRVHGELRQMNLPVLTPEDVKEMLLGILDEKQQEDLLQTKELNFSYSLPGVSRFRGSAVLQRGSLDVVLRVIPWHVPALEELGLPEIVQEFARYSRGLVLVTGPAGSGKSTTLASLINQVNEERAVNIVTVESPVEFLHKHKKSIVRQREVGSDTHSFAAALQHLLRHDPDVVLISELESRESISAALKAAETGHLVFSAMHTRTVPATIHRLAGIYPDSLQKYVRLQLADCLKAVISQQLVPRADGGGRVAAVEVLINTAAVSEMIREGQVSQLYTAMKTGRSFGMQTMDKALSDLCLQGAISREEALKRAANRSELERLLRS